MAEPLFITQAKLETSIESGEVTFEGGILTFLAQKRQYQLAPAVKVLGLIDGQDQKGLVGHVLPIADIAAQGGEHYRDSVLFGDTAYQCDEGFVGVEQGVPVAPAAPVAPAGDKQANDTDLLVDFLLKNL